MIHLLSSPLILACAAATLCALFAVPPALAQREVESLAGEWRFLLNGPKPADSPGGMPDVPFNDTIELPGTTETRQKGELHGPGWHGQLTRIRKFEGPAWYQREIEVPASWQDKRVSLFLERTKYTQVWIDGKPVGDDTTICSPQEYNLGSLSPGPHTLTIAVDNARKPIHGDNHQLSDNTQGNWNGIIGRIELRATDPVWLADVQVYPNAAARRATVKVAVSNSAGHDGAGTLTVTAAGKGISGATTTVDVTWTSSGGVAEVELPLGDSAALWDEFRPDLHTLTVRLDGNGIEDERTVTFGLRDFSSRPIDDHGAQFTINGRVTFLRGRHDACVFPLTGHPPMDVDGWTRYFQVCRDFGLNHVRFHSWTPPEAAFVAADRMGFYLQPELPFWGDFNDDVKAKLKPEAERIQRAFGNHPSFVMFAMGNENRGSRQVLASLVNELRDLDSRHLYAQGSNAFMWDPIIPESDDFLVSAAAKRAPDAPARHVRGSNADLDHKGHLQVGPANTTFDYADAIAGTTKPVVSHETGQWSVYPDFREIEKYTGVMRAYNFEHFREKLERAGMLDQADAFFRASGILAAMGYRQEIESALRTPGFGGFQILDLQDFPGQGTALVGVVNAFMEPKGVISPEKWREFCAPIVLLARFDKYTWTTADTFTAEIQVAHYGDDDLAQSTAAWRLRGTDDAVLASGTLQPRDIERGGLRSLGSIATSLNVVREATRLNLELELEGTGIRTSYPVWVYPAEVDTTPPPTVTLARAFDAAARSALDAGGRVLLIPDERFPLARTVGGGFATDFWNWPMFHNKPGTMGLLMDPSHPALARFPTEFHSNWQWFELAQHGQPVVLDDLPDDYRPIVQTIDNFDRVHLLGTIFELKVGAGRLLVCTPDLVSLNDRPEARQLLVSLQEYAASDAFNPTTEVSADVLAELFVMTVPMVGTASASSFERSWQNFSPARAADGNDHTPWRAAVPRERRRGGGDGNFGEQTAAPGAGGPEQAAPPPSHWWQFTFDAPQEIAGMEVLFDRDEPGYRYTVETSRDGETWTMLSDQRDNDFTTARHALAAPADDVKALRITIIAVPDRTPIAIREVRVLRRQ